MYPYFFSFLFFLPFPFTRRPHRLIFNLRPCVPHRPRGRAPHLFRGCASLAPSPRAARRVAVAEAGVLRVLTHHPPQLLPLLLHMGQGGARAPLLIPTASTPVSSKLSPPRRASMVNPLVRIAAVEGGDHIRCALAALVHATPNHAGQRRPMAAMGLAIARRSWKKQVSTPTLCSPLSQPEFRGFFLGSDQLGSVWQLELEKQIQKPGKNVYQTRPKTSHGYREKKRN